MSCRYRQIGNRLNVGRLRTRPAVYAGQNMEEADVLC